LKDEVKAIKEGAGLTDSPFKARLMFQTRCMKIKLKENSLDRVREWAETLNRRKDEVIETLRDESVIIESVFLERTPQGDFLIYYMKAESLEQARAAVTKTTHAIDEYHRQFKRETWDGGSPLELLVDFDRIAEVAAE
jgi:hypothetical protein